MDQPPRRSSRVAAIVAKPQVPELDSDDEPAPVASRGSYGKKKRAAEAAAVPPAAPLSKARIKRARLELNDRMTSAGQRADLSKHALGHLLVASPAVLEMLSMRDARHLRRADKALRSIVAEHPWSDIASPVHCLAAAWRASFPAATACNLRTTLTKAVAATLTGLTSFHCEGVLSTKSDPELPLSVVRVMPRLTALHAEYCPMDSDAPVWRELGGLRELRLHHVLPRSVGNLLGHVASLRKLELHSWNFQGSFSPGFTAVPLLESLVLQGIPVTGSDLAPLTQLSVLKVSFTALQPDFLAQVCPSLRELSLNCCRGITNATFAPPALASLRELTLLTTVASASTAITTDALAGFASLEVFRSSGYRKLVSQKAVNVLGSMGRLRRLLWSQDGGKSRALVGFKALSRCPITELDFSGSAHCDQTLKASRIARLPKTLRSFRYSGTVTGDKPWSSLVRVSLLDLTGSKDTFGADCFSSLRRLRTLGLSRCPNVRRDALLTLPAGVTSLALDDCRHLEVDDELLVALGTQLPRLSSLSMARSLVSEDDPVFLNPGLAELRLKTPVQVKRHLSALRKKAKDAAEDAEEEEEDASMESGGDSDDGAGGAAAGAPARAAKAPVSAKERRRRAQEMRFGYLGEPPHTSIAGWTALMRAPRGLFSLDVRGNDLSYDSYALLRLHVAELRAYKVKSPEEEAVAAERRDSAAAKREEKKRRLAEGAAAAQAGGAAAGAQGQGAAAQ